MTRRHSNSSRSVVADHLQTAVTAVNHFRSDAA